MRDIFENPPTFAFASTAPRNSQPLARSERHRSRVHGGAGPSIAGREDLSSRLEALRETIEHSDADVVVWATPIDLAQLLAVGKPIVRARYEFAEAGEPTLAAEKTTTGFQISN